MRVIDATAECTIPRYGARVGLRDRSLVVVHRCTMGSDVASIASGYRISPEARAATAGQMPYHFVVGVDGVIEQARPLTAVTPHARQYNSRGIAVAAVGDFRLAGPPDVQYYALSQLCAYLLVWTHLTPDAVRGHTELPNASRVRGKVCPGEHLSMGDLREYLYRWLPTCEAKGRLFVV